MTAVLGLLTLSQANFAGAQEAPLPSTNQSSLEKAKETASDFLRFSEDDARGRLEAAIVRYARPIGNGRGNGSSVELIGAVHVGDTAYYDFLNERMETYDALLYEMVGNPEELKDAEKLAANQNPLRMIMRMVKGILKLDYQLDAIDYSKENFVHADLDMEQFSGMMAERGENMFTILQNAMRNSAKQSDTASTATAAPFDLAPILAALASPDSASALKLVMAKQFDTADILLDSAESEGGTVILTERNKHVMKVIEEQSAAGKMNLGVFYGAAHLADLERRLIDAGYLKVANEWVTAWDIPKPPKPVAPAPVNPAESPTQQE